MSSSNTSGSTGQLIRLCAGYFGFYVVTGVLEIDEELWDPSMPRCS